MKDYLLLGISINDIIRDSFVESWSVSCVGYA